jgi:type IV secretory pathway TrbD component
MPMMPAAPEPHPIHSALYRPVLMAGVDRGLVIVEATLVTALAVMGGLDWRTLGAAALLVLVLHPAMAWAARGDAAIAEVYVRSLGAQDYYPAAAGWRSSPPAVRPAVPGARG